MAVDTFGLRHLHLLVAEHDRSVAFYRSVFGMEVTFRDGDILFLTSRNGRDSLALHQAVTPDERARVGVGGGVDHFGITVADRSRLGEAIALVRAAGGELVEEGEHASGVPYAYVRDPDGYLIEI